MSSPVVTPRSPAPRRRRGTLSVAVVVLALMLGVGVVSAAWLRPVPAPATAATVLVPPDGYQPISTWEVNGHDGDAMVDNARLAGGELADAAPRTLLTFIEFPSWVPLEQVHWWREGIFPDGPDAETRYRLRSVTARGIVLHGQSWGDLGLTFGPGLLELPADVAPGQHWSSSGRALGKPTSVQLHYANTSAARTAADPSAAKRGCLDVTSSTVLSRTTGAADTWTEQNTWCPGQGVIATNGKWGDTTWSQRPEDRPVTIQPSILTDGPLAGDPAHWQQGTVNAVSGDATFGSEPYQVLTALPPVATAGRTIAYAHFGTADLAMMLELNGGKTWWQDYWARAGTGSSRDGHAPRILSLTAVGSMVLATTTDRALVSYVDGGRRLWTAQLDEVAVAAPIRVGTDRIAVATLGGTIFMLDALDGHIVWRAHYGRGLSTPLATDGQTIAGILTNGDAVAVDAKTGHTRWHHEPDSYGQTPAVVDGVVVIPGFGGADGYDARTGELRWSRSNYGSMGVAVGGSGQVVLAADQAAIALNAADGREEWRVNHATAPVRAGAGWAMIVDDQLVLADADGRARRRWPLQAGVTGRSLAVAGGRLWVFGTLDSELVAQWFGAA